MPLSFEYFSADANTTAEGVFLPVASLWNVQASELASTNASRESRVLFGLLEVLANPNATFASINNKLGISSSYPNPVGAGTNLVNQTYSFTTLYYANLANNTIQPVPLQSSSNTGRVRITDVFAGATKLSANAATGGAGVLIPTAQLTPYGGPSHASIDVAADSRNWFAALFLYLAANATVRSGTNASAVVAVNPLANAVGALPSTALIEVSGLNAANQVTNMILTRTVTITVQKRINTQNETIEPHHVTA